MVRRTKEEAQQTRSQILEAAEKAFYERGISRTTLAEIAGIAGVTRGAIYWHFKDKADLFNAMMERVSMPLETTLAEVGLHAARQDDPLQSLRDSMTHALKQTANDERTRRVFEVATHKVEYVDEMQAVRERHLRVRNECMAMTRAALQAAVKRQAITLPMPLATAALGLHVMVDGLIQNWLLDPEAFDLVRCGRQTMDAYLGGLGFSLAAAPAPRRVATARAKAAPGAVRPAP
jgi:TetR/AcrR family acrAB operon transcriptional repressor